MPACSVPGCKSRSVAKRYQVELPEPKCHFFRPPENQLDAWKTAIHYGNSKQMDSKKCVCHKHFRPDELLWARRVIMPGGNIVEVKYKLPRLKQGAIPSIFSWNSPPELPEDSTTSSLEKPPESPEIPQETCSSHSFASDTATVSSPDMEDSPLESPSTPMEVDTEIAESELLLTHQDDSPKREDTESSKSEFLFAHQDDSPTIEETKIANAEFISLHQDDSLHKENTELSKSEFLFPHQDDCPTIEDTEIENAEFIFLHQDDSLNKENTDISQLEFLWSHQEDSAMEEDSQIAKSQLLSTHQDDSTPHIVIPIIPDLRSPSPALSESPSIECQPENEFFTEICQAEIILPLDWMKQKTSSGNIRFLHFFTTKHFMTHEIMRSVISVELIVKEDMSVVVNIFGRTPPVDSFSFEIKPIESIEQLQQMLYEVGALKLCQGYQYQPYGKTLPISKGIDDTWRHTSCPLWISNELMRPLCTFCLGLPKPLMRPAKPFAGGTTKRIRVIVPQRNKERYENIFAMMS